MNIVPFSDKQAFVAQSVAVFESCYTNGGRYVALAGGRTPQPVYQALAYSSVLNFESTHFYVVDERYVPFDHEDSNTGMIAKAFADIDTTHIHTFNTEVPIDKSLDEYEAELKNIPHSSCDLMVLGIGTDGHIASLFPGSDGVFVSDHLVTHTTTDTLAVTDRLTMTLPMILKSKQILVLIQGAQKKDMLEEILESDASVSEMPARALLQHSNVLVHIYD